MDPKPDGCRGCPLYGDGWGFVPDLIPPSPAVVIVGQNPGANEEDGRRIVGYDRGFPNTEPCPPQPLIGLTGYMLRRDYLPLTGLTGATIGYANILKCRWQRGEKHTNDSPPAAVLTAAVAHCTTNHLSLPVGVPVIAMGALAWTTLGGPGTITDWRGYAAP